MSLFPFFFPLQNHICETCYEGKVDFACACLELFAVYAKRSVKHQLKNSVFSWSLGKTPKIQNYSNCQGIINNLNTKFYISIQPSDIKNAIF